MSRTKKTTAPVVLRQGDVLLLRVDAIPEGARRVARRKGRLVLELGEATGHAHAIAATDVSLLRVGDVDYLVIGGDAVALTHEEHGTIELPPETSWRRGYQVEEEGEAVRAVAD